MNYYNVGDTFRNQYIIKGAADLLYMIDNIETTPNYFLDTGGPMYNIKFKVYHISDDGTFFIGYTSYEVRSLEYRQDDLYIKGNWSFKTKKLKKLSFV